MPSPSSSVGPLSLPLAAGSTGQKINDPAVDALLSFLGFWLKNTLDARLANHSGVSPDACPEANRFSFDPADPRGHHVRLPVPSLFAWWAGRSTHERLGMIYEYRTRPIEVLYVFQELPQLAEMDRRSGLMAVVDAAFHKASDHGRHPSFAYGDAPAGTMLDLSVAEPDLFSFEYQGGTPGRFGIGEGSERRDGSDSARDYPALRATFMVRERIEQPTLLDPDDVLGDVLLNINASDGSTPETVPFMDRYLPGPDGSEQE